MIARAITFNENDNLYHFYIKHVFLLSFFAKERGI